MCVVGAHSPTVCHGRGGMPTDSRIRLSQPSAASARFARRRADSDAARAIAAVLIEGFDKHYRLFRATSAAGEGALRGGAPGRRPQQAVQERIRFYDERVARVRRPAARRVRRRVARRSRPGRRRSSPTSACSSTTSQPELAETFFNSVITRILRRTYSDNDLIFVRARDLDRVHRVRPADLPQLLPEVDGEPGECFAQIFRDFGWSRPFADLERDLDHAAARARRAAGRRRGRTSSRTTRSRC